MRLYTVIGTLTLAVVTACSAPVTADTNGPGVPATATTYSVETVTELPSAADFSIGVRVLRKACFGQFGCNITYQINPRYTGDGLLRPRTPLRVIYEVTGGRSGVQVNNFTIDSEGTASFRKEEFTATPTEGTTLIARATSVITS